MRSRRVLALSLCAASMFAVQAANAEASAVHLWEYRGTVTTVESRDGKATVRYYDSLHLTATRAGTPPTVNSPILRFRSALPMRGSTGPATPMNAVWMQTPGRYAGHMPTPHSMTYALEMADALPLPNPFTKTIKPGTTRIIGLPLFSTIGDLVPLRQQVMRMETVAGRTCYRVERTATRNQPVGLGMLLESYTEILWIDTVDGTVVKYDGRARIAEPSSVVMQITTALQRQAVRTITAEEWTQREQQASLLSKSLPLLEEVPFLSREEAARAQQLLEQFRGSYPNSPYRAAYDSLKEALGRETRVLERTLRQADMVGKPAPAFALRDLTGNTRSLTEFRGSVLLVNFFASWCGPCNDEVPQIEAQFWRKLRPRGLVVLGIDGREENNPIAKARRFRDRHKLTFPLLIDTESKMTAAYHVEAIPVNVVIDRDGIVRYAATGFDSAALNAVLDPLLNP